MERGRVEGIFVTASHGAPPKPVDGVRAHAGKGLEGNRYFYADGAPSGKALTLIAAEALEGLEERTGIAVAPPASRRNVLTRGIDVNALVGRRFRVGEIECYGVQLCEPCSHLQKLTQPGVMKGLVHQAGINVDILTDGELRVGDEIAPA